MWEPNGWSGTRSRRAQEGDEASSKHPFSGTFAVTLRDQLTARGCWKNGGPGLSRCMDPIENGDIPARYVSLPDGTSHGKSLILIHMGVSKNRGNPQIIHF